MTAQAPAALGHDSKFASVWDPPARRVVPDAESSLSPTVRLRAALLGLAISLVLTALCFLAAILLSTALFDGYSGGLW